MMQAIDALMTRRSIRVFESRAVGRETIDRILDVLFRSPSAADARPWEFAAIDRRDVLDRLEAAMPKCDMLKTAPLAILVCADPSREKIPGFWPQDCAAATQSALVAVHGLGLGGVWIGLHPVADRERAVRDILGMPDGLIPFSLMAIGYPAETPAIEDRREDSRVHWNGWSAGRDNGSRRGG